MASALRDVLEEIYQQSIPLYGLIDSYSFFSTVTQYNALREKRQSIEVDVVREAYAKFELANLGFVRTAYNLADPMTKHVKTRILKSSSTREWWTIPSQSTSRARRLPMTLHLTRRTCLPLTYLSSLAPCAETQKGFMSSTIHGSSVHVLVLCFVLCTCYGFVFCAVYKALSMSKLSALCFGTRHGPA
jgi:hypothetical protein